MKTFVHTLAAVALALSLTVSAFAQTSDTTTIQQTNTTTPAATVTTSTTTVTTFTNVNDDPSVVAALAAMSACEARYDRLINGILDHSQQIDFAAMQKHAAWYYFNGISHDERNGYLAYMEERLHMTADQEREAGRIEAHFLMDITPLWVSYQNALAAAIAARQTQVSTTTVSQPIAAPPPEEETTTTTVTPPAPQQVQVKQSTVKTQKTFIRNTDLK